MAKLPFSNPQTDDPISKSQGGTYAPKQTSATTWVPVGTGSRPTRSEFPIPTSAPPDPRTRGTNQAPPGWLK